MTTNTKIKTDIQTLDVGSPKVNLFTLDATDIGGSTYRFTPGPLGGSSVIFNSLTYTPLPVAIEGIDKSSDGKLPRPKITLSNITKALLAEVVAYNDLVGAVVTRQRTYQKYLDGESAADPNAEFPQDVFIIKRKLRQNKFLIQFELRAALDLEHILIPGRQVLPGCSLVYRTWGGSSFDYTKATCPYTGTGYFTAAGVATTAANDVCGQDLYSCRLRYSSSSDQLPMNGFPGVGQFGQPYRR